MSRKVKDEQYRFFTVSEPRTHEKGHTEYKVTARVSGNNNTLLLDNTVTTVNPFVVACHHVVPLLVVTSRRVLW